MYGKFNLRFFGSKVWNEIDETFKTFEFSLLQKKTQKSLSR